MLKNNNRPITYIPTTYKKLTSIRKERKAKFIESKDIFPLEPLRIKELLRYYNRLDAIVSKHTREAKEKNIQFVKKVMNLLIISISH